MTNCDVPQSTCQSTPFWYLIKMLCCSWHNSPRINKASIPRRTHHKACAGGPYDLVSLRYLLHFRSSSGTLPPFSASFSITCLCSQMFIVAELFLSPV